MGQPGDPQTIAVGRWEFDGRYILGAINKDGGDVAYLWDVNTGNVIQRFSGHITRIGRLGLSAAKGQVVTIPASGPIHPDLASDMLTRFWSISTGRVIRRVARVPDSLLSISDTELLSSSSTQTYLWDERTGESTFIMHGGFVGVNLARRELATSARDRVTIWDLEKFREVAVFEPDSDENWIVTADISEDFTRLLMTYRDSSLRVYDIQDRRLLFELPPAERFTTFRHLIRGGSKVVIGLPENLVRVYDIDGEEGVVEYRIGGERIQISPDRKFLLTTNSPGSGARVRVWELETGTLISSVSASDSRLQGRFPNVWVAMFAEDSSSFLVMDAVGHMAAKILLPSGRVQSIVELERHPDDVPARPAEGAQR